MIRGRTIAVIDVGSNSVRLLVGRELSPVAFEVVDEERFDARLGEGQAGGDVTAEAMERGLRALRIVTQVAASYGPSSLTVVGTEALRRAPNAQVFVDLAREQTGLPVRILSSRDEAFAGFLGVINSTGLHDGHLLDIGGGSLELMRVQGRSLSDVQSAPLGAIYARERYFRTDPPSPRDIRSLRKAVQQQISVSQQGPVLFGSGGAVRNLARIARIKRRYPLRRIHGFVIERGEMRRLAAALAKASPEARRQMPGLGSNRVDILPAAAIVVDEVMELTGATTLTVAGQGLREGLVWQELRPESAIINDVRSASIAGLARANGVDELAAEPVVSAAAELFAATAPLHGFGPAELELLRAAARLAGIGMHVDYYNRDRHAEYLVHSADLHGFDHREVILLAALVRWATSGTPDLSLYRGIVQPDDTRRAAVLATLLGAAQAIRRRTPSPVLDFSVSLKRTGVRVALTGGGPIDAEVYELERQQKRFEANLKAPLLITARIQSSDA
jgi:exopolyphosphatase/guanosine-5'-triphosphate,3'-diphosphate pyrophosphatase